MRARARARARVCVCVPVNLRESHWGTTCDIRPRTDDLRSTELVCMSVAHYRKGTMQHSGREKEDGEEKKARG